MHSVLKPFLLVSALAALTACQTTTETVQATGAPKLTRSANVGPGNAPVSADQATAYFHSLCGQAKSGRSALEAAAAANGFAQNSKTTTYYHQRKDLSVKLTDNRCSIVFVSNDSYPDILGSFNALKGSLKPPFVRDAGVLSGEHYYSAAINV